MSRKFNLSLQNCPPIHTFKNTKLAVVVKMATYMLLLWIFVLIEQCFTLSESGAIAFVKDTCLFSRYSDHHTYCLPPNPSCKIKKRLVNINDIVDILNEHNKYRSNLAMGGESIGHLPTAADMLEMVWDDELAAVAQAHADQCKFQHDCNECRQTQNFEAGQNLYSYSTPKRMPTPNWERAIKNWYDEVSDFDSYLISPFNKDGGRGIIAHFSQVEWAKTWKIGCGYTVFLEGENYKELYMCNYGPAGNVKEQSMYEVGKPCSRCPINSICLESNTGVSYPGLCRLIDDTGPHYKPDFGKNLIFSCDFQSFNNCPVQIPLFQKPWEITNTLSDSYIGVVLKGGESTKIDIARTFVSDVPSCFSIRYRKGPNIAGQEASNTAIEHLKLTQSGSQTDVPLTENGVHFYKYGMNLKWINMIFTVSISFSVPFGKPDQYFELRDITFKKGSC